MSNRAGIYNHLGTDVEQSSGHSKTTGDVKKWSALRVFNIDRYVQKQSGETGLPEVDIHISPKNVEAFGHLKSVLG